MIIGGRQVAGSKAFDVINPFDESVVGQAPSCSREELDEAVKEARKAFPAWSSKTFEERKEYLGKMSQVLADNADSLIELLVKEQGKGLPQAKGELLGSQGWLKAAMRLDNPNKLHAEDEKKKIHKVYRPLGVVGCITAWNFPLSLIHFKISSALLSGCTVIVKPSEHTPLASLEAIRLFNEVLPPGVLSIVTSEKGELGAWMVEHPGIDKISFTGSTPTGKKIMETAAKTLKRVTLELGGNDPAIVLKDVDPKKAAKGLFGAAFGNSGQICIAAKRVYVDEAIYEDTLQALAEIAKNAPFGNGLEKDVVFGPLNNAMQYDKVRELLIDALDNGAEMVCGEVPPARGGSSKGFMIKPVVLRNVKEGMRIVDEEQFGPVLPVMSYKTIEEAVDRANDSEYGLGASVWTKDLDRGEEIANQLHAGTVWVNTHSEIDGSIAFGGAKCSGVGFEGGDEGLLAFMQLHVIRTKRNAKL